MVMIDIKYLEDLETANTALLGAIKILVRDAQQVMDGKLSIDDTNGFRSSVPSAHYAIQIATQKRKGIPL